jgi:streptomycin 6-kinase
MVSEKFKHRIISVWGERGKEWLERLPTIIAACEERWTLTVQSVAPDLSYNFVAYVMIKNGMEAILKIGVPNPELITEIEALQHYQGRYAVRLLKADINLGALVMQRLVPGQPLSEWPDDEKATVIAAQLMRDLPIPEPSKHRFPTIENWNLAFNRLRARFDGQSGPLPRRMVEKAERLFNDLQGSSPGGKLLHGDLHHDNILSNGENSWLVIDPKGVIGDPAYEAARFQRNPIPGFLRQENPQAVAERRVEILASILEIDRARLLAWGFFDAMLGACWSIEDNEDWNYFLSCAQILDPLVD